MERRVRPLRSASGSASDRAMTDPDLDPARVLVVVLVYVLVVLVGLVGLLILA